MKLMKSVRWTATMLFAMTAILAGVTHAQAQEVPFAGMINQDDATLRAGAGTPYYIVGQAKKGTRVTVVERIAEWYQISPPPGVYSYVSKAFVDVRGDGSTGTVRQRLSAYAASINGPGESYRRQLELLAGTVVKIVGEEGSFFKVEPPEGSYVYIQTKNVDLAPDQMTPAAPQTPAAPEAPAAPQTPAAPETPAVVETPAAPAAPATPEPTKRPEVVKPTPAVKPVETTPAAPATPATPATPIQINNEPAAAGELPATPNTASANTPAPKVENDVKVVVDDPARLPQVEEKPAPRPLVVSPNLLAVENAFYEAQKLPVENQPLADLKTKYSALQNDDSLTLGDQRLLAVRMAQMDRNIALAKAIDNLRDVRKDLQPSTTILKVPVQKGPVRYDAMGMLLASSVYDGATLPRLYRLVTAGEGRTIAYIRPTGNFDPAKALGSTVGVVGVTRYDTALKLRVIDAEKLVILEPALEN